MRNRIYPEILIYEGFLDSTENHQIDWVEYNVFRKNFVVSKVKVCIQNSVWPTRSEAPKLQVRKESGAQYNPDDSY